VFDVPDGGRYTTSPRSTFYHTMIACNQQYPGGACFMLLPEAFRQCVRRRRFRAVHRMN
jgi:hypothetical protein